MLEKFYDFVAGNSAIFAWLSVGLLVLAIVFVILFIVFVSKYHKKKAYTKQLLNSIDTLDKKVGALETNVKTISASKEALDAECATLKSENFTLNEKVNSLTTELSAEQECVSLLTSERDSLSEKLAHSVSAEEVKKLEEELEKSKKKTLKVDTLITKVEELTAKTKPVIKKVIKKEIAKIKKYSKEDLKAMYKHELMTLANSLKLTGWTRFSKDKLVDFVYENLPKEQKKKEKGE